MMEWSSNKKLNDNRNLTFISTEQNQSEINQGSLSEPPKDHPYRLSEAVNKQVRIDQLLEMADKSLEEQLLTEGLLNLTEEPAFLINKSCIEWRKHNRLPPRILKAKKMITR